MPFGREERLARLRASATSYVDVALGCALREYPVMPFFIATGPGPYPTHRELHPAFFGSFDWHSCVEMHWVVARLLRLFPDDTPGERARAVLDDLLTEANIRQELAYYLDPNHRTMERPYGWGWLLTLQHELLIWDDPDARRWAAAVAPLADTLAANLAAWWPTAIYPLRTGTHYQSAFSMSRCLDFAQLQAEGGNRALLDAITATARRWFAADVDYPAHYEPSGADFLSGGLSEAELMSRVLDGGEFVAWLNRFLPKLAAAEPSTLFFPATVSDPTDGQVAHLHGLNLSRAWDFVRLAEVLPSGDARTAPLMAAAERHANASLDQVAGSDYMVEHWLAVYAVLLLSV
jgi:Protein of unknown function (DUF2891)